MEYTVQLPKKLQARLNDMARRSQEKQRLADRVDDIDYELIRNGMPSYTQLGLSLRGAIQTIDILLRAYDKGANPEHFAAMARLDLADIERKIGIGATFN